MARRYNGSSDKLSVAIGNCSFLAPYSLLFLNQMTGRDGQWCGIITGFSSALAFRGYGIERDLNNKVALTSDFAFNAVSTTTTVVADGWCLHGVTKAAGSATPRYHRYKYSTNTFVHENMSAAIGDGTAPGAGGFIELGGDAGSGDWFQGDMELAGIVNRVISDAEFEQLPFTLMAWHSLVLRGGWQFDQSATSQLVVDFTGGGANESSKAGTSVSTVSVPIFNRFDGVISWTKPPAAAGGATPSDSDSGTGTDSATLAAAISSSDSGSGTETTSSSATYSSADTGSGTDSATLAAGISSSDSNGTTTETATVKISVSSSDSGAGSDATVLAAVVTSADTGSGADNGSVAVDVIFKNSSDSGVGTDNGSVTSVQISTVDVGTGAETSSVVAKVSSADIGSAIDAGSLIFGITVSDVGVGTDATILVAAPVGNDSGIGIDSSQAPVVSISSADIGISTQLATIKAVLPTQSDFGIGVDVGVRISGEFLSADAPEFVYSATLPKAELISAQLDKPTIKKAGL